MSTPVMIRLVALAMMLSSLFQGRSVDAIEPNRLTQPEKLAGWKLLFDGRTKNGWRRYRGGSTDGWKVVDGALVRAAKGAGDLISEEQFEYFDLAIEFRISPNGNSGVMFGVTEEYKIPWQSGPEIQVLDSADADAKHRAGALYDLYPARVKASRPAGEWNEIQLHYGPDGAEVQLNGIRLYRFQIGSADWNRRVARSKFSKYANFAKAKKGHICLQDHGNEVAFRNIRIRPIAPDGSVPNPVTGRLAVRPVRVFERVKWAEWEPEDDKGRIQAQRPIVLTHAGDGSGRIFVATQRGVIHVIRNTQEAQTSKVFLDISDRVMYKDRENEEGFLGLAFHPKYAQNGKFFVYYTTRHAPHTSIVAGFRVSKEDPNRADPGSEVEVMRIEQPFWNHNGGTIAFGPDGYLYIGLGDGGAANDPNGNGQNLGTLLGSILRIDVDRKSSGRNYGIPKDNPFVGRAGARPEIFAHGLRNVWRIAFDRETGVLWAGDVGQNTWEEIDLIVKGGNYGWNYREGFHPFGVKSLPADLKVIDPIWEYDHTVGKSITGGFVYRGKRVPELQGLYLYADYVSGKLWGLRYDASKGTVIGNYEIPSPPYPVISFGEDEAGEAYFLVVTPDGKGIYSLR